MFRLCKQRLPKPPLVYAGRGKRQEHPRDPLSCIRARKPSASVVAPASGILPSVSLGGLVCVESRIALPAFKEIVSSSNTVDRRAGVNAFCARRASVLNPERPFRRLESYPSSSAALKETPSRCPPPDLDTEPAKIRRSRNEHLMPTVLMHASHRNHIQSIFSDGSQRRSR
jgi:hypothetical protein